MSDDLVSSQVLKEKEKDEILELLGEPSDSSPTWFRYVLDYGYLTNFSLNIIVDSVDYKVKDVAIED